MMLRIVKGHICYEIMFYMYSCFKLMVACAIWQKTPIPGTCWRCCHQAGRIRYRYGVRFDSLIPWVWSNVFFFLEGNSSTKSWKKLQQHRYNCKRCQRHRETSNLSGDFFRMHFDMVLVFVVMVDTDLYMYIDIEIFNRYKKVVLECFG